MHDTQFHGVPVKNLCSCIPDIPIIYIKTIFTKYPWHRDFNLCEVVSIYIPTIFNWKLKKIFLAVKK